MTFEDVFDAAAAAAECQTGACRKAAAATETSAAAVPV